MKTMAAIIFFGIFFLITGLISFYIYIRGLQSIPPNSILRYPYTIAFWIIASAFLGGRILERFLPSILSELFIWIGSFWIAAMVYFLLAVVSLDLLRLINHFAPLLPPGIRANYAQFKCVLSAGVIGMVAVTLIGGHINSRMPRVKKLNLKISKKAGTLKTLNIVAASDIHLGTIVGRSRFDVIVSKINSLNPDLILLPGDIVDEDLAPVIRQNLGESLKSLQARFGVFGVTGNHEYIGGVERACAYLTGHNIVMLRDQSVLVGDAVYLVGREDRAIGQFNGHLRKALPDLMSQVDRRYPVIMMDHQPFGLKEAVEQGIDLQISGHTHYGQLWPISHIVESIYELAWGYKKTGDTHFYVSNGVGTWGPPVRIGNRPEIIHICLTFQ